MDSTLIAVIVFGMLLLLGVALVVIVFRPKDSSLGPVLSQSISQTEARLLDEFSRQRREFAEIGGMLRGEIETRLKAIEDRNDKKLDEMRQTVDEKLQGTLEQRLGESFKQVSERLEQVHKGLGEMQTLAAGVGDLKKVMTNVKTRGTWGEVQLGALLEQVLTPEQFARNVSTTGSSERVEYAVKLPGQEVDGAPVWLPIDAKFPVEDFQRLIEASEAADAEGVEKAAKELENRVWTFAKSIRDKYVLPPATTDFGILFLPTEGLYAEVMRRTGFVDEIQRELRVTLAGPSTLLALLTSLQMGFRTLQIQQRSSEVWALLGVVKSEFGKYSDVLAQVKTKLDQASKTIESAETRTRQIQRKLRDVEEVKAIGAGEAFDDYV
jgi:DNA recombination protein RmuC